MGKINSAEAKKKLRGIGTILHDKHLLLIGGLCCLLFGSCSVPSEDSPMFYLWVRFYAKGIERRVIYKTENTTYEVPDFIVFENRFISQRSEFNPVSTRKYYANYSVPFEFYIGISIRNNDIKEIKFTNCKLILNDNEYNMFDTDKENFKLSELIVWYSRQASIGRYKGDFFNEYKFITNNNDEYYYSGFDIGFIELNFDYNINEKIKIKYSVTVTDVKNNIFDYNFEIIFLRTYEEKYITKKEIGWKEITKEEWKKYTK